jgi:hypothetical protein
MAAKRLGGYYWITRKGKAFPEPALYNAKEELWATIASVKWLKDSDLQEIGRPILSLLAGGKKCS